MVWPAAPHALSMSVSAQPPCTAPSGLSILSVGVPSKATKPSVTSTRSKLSVTAIDGGANLPETMPRRASIPVRLIISLAWSLDMRRSRLSDEIDDAFDDAAVLRDHAVA